MTSSEIFKAAIQKRSRVAWWTYLPAAAVLVLFAVMGWGEGGAYGGALFVLLLVGCAFQWAHPTVLVWGLLLVVFCAYSVAVIATPHNGRFAEYLLFFLCGAVPAVALLFGRPRGQ